jgi:hypothetical protein
MCVGNIDIFSKLLRFSNCYDSVACFVTTVWDVLLRQCGMFCYDSVACFVTTVWHVLFVVYFINGVIYVF